MSEYPWDFENNILAAHDQPCDCAICDEIHFQREMRKKRRKEAATCDKVHKCAQVDCPYCEIDRLRESAYQSAKESNDKTHIICKLKKERDDAVVSKVRWVIEADAYKTQNAELQGLIHQLSVDFVKFNDMKEGLESILQIEKFDSLVDILGVVQDIARRALHIGWRETHV